MNVPFASNYLFYLRHSWGFVSYHIVDDAELEKVAASGHHGGVVMLVKRKPISTLAQYLQQSSRKRQDCLLALDGVGNAHKIGRPIYDFFICDVTFNKVLESLTI